MQAGRRRRRRRHRLGRGRRRARRRRAARRPAAGATLDLIRKHRVALKGPCTTPVGKGFRSINVRLRQGLDLYASVRPVQHAARREDAVRRTSISSSSARTPRGCTPGWSTSSCPGVVESLRVITRPAAERIVRYAFELARTQGRRRVTFCHKADVMPLSRRPVPRRAPARWPTSTRSSSSRRCTIDNAVPGAGARPDAVRRAGDGEPVRRRDQRPVRRPGRRAGPGAGGEHRQPVRGVRGGPRQRPGHRRQGAGQPDRGARGRRR